MNRSSATDQSIGQTDKREVSATPIPSTDAVKRFRKKPVVIEAVQWTGDNLREVIAFTGRHHSAESWTWEHFEKVVREGGLRLFTLEDGPNSEAKHYASAGDWIIKGVKGEIYACKPDIFAATYEIAAATPTTKKLWLWKNFVAGRPEYWAFDNPYPTHGGGDPFTMGEPCGYAIFKESTQGRFDVTEEQVLANIKRAAAHSAQNATAKHCVRCWRTTPYGIHSDESDDCKQPGCPLLVSETAPRIIGLDWGKPGGDYSAFACSCGDVRTEKDGPCKRKNCPIRSAENTAKGKA